MPKKGIYVVILIILVIFLGVMFFVFGDKKTKEEVLPFVAKDNSVSEGEIEETLLIVGKTTWKCLDDEWSLVAKKKEKQGYNGKSFRVYDGTHLKGDYYLRYEDEWIAYDTRSKSPEIENFILAYPSNQKINVLDFEEKVIEKDSFVEQVLKDNEIPVDSLFSSIYKVSVDFDHDSIFEDFYIISNAFPIDFEPNISFSMAFMVDEGEIHELYTDVSDIVSLGTCKPYYKAFVDTNDDGISEVVLSCGKFSATEQIDMLYQFEYNHFKLLISNK